ncbi:MAG: hypothetical protein KJN63_01975, partial [Acidimicrobiia bacterium]|nr:hypothetical protein [Acidimicrobiia bacterium]
APFLKIGGSLLVSEPPGRDTRRRWPTAGLARCGLDYLEQWQTEAGSYIRLRRNAEALDGLPRRGARKRPLF